MGSEDPSVGLSDNERLAGAPLQFLRPLALKVQPRLNSTAAKELAKPRNWARRKVEGKVGNA
jgi:hypothetical protein